VASTEAGLAVVRQQEIRTNACRDWSSRDSLSSTTVLRENVMMISRRGLLGAAAAISFLPPARAEAAIIKIGMMNAKGQSPEVEGVYPRQAVAEFTANKDLKIEILVADHENKPDVGVAIARKWFDEDGVDAILNIPITSVTLPVAALCREKNKVALISGGGSSDLTGKQCSPNTVHWTYDTYMLSKVIGDAITKAGGQSWFFILPDFIFGRQLFEETSRFVVAAGGKVLGNAIFPFPDTPKDFSGMLQQAQQSGATVLGLCSGGSDLENTIRQAQAMGLYRTMRIAAVTILAPNVLNLGLESAQSSLLTEAFYWDLNDRTRAFTDRIRPRIASHIPYHGQAGNYAATLHYLKAVADLGGAAAKADGAAVVARMKAMPTDDDCFGPGRIREDGRTLHPAYLFRVKTPAESTGAWDLFTLVATTPAEQAFRPLSEGGCPLVKN
jgi:branched-chain amino acid transport system substrate-binding protein